MHDANDHRPYRSGFGTASLALGIITLAGTGLVLIYMVGGAGVRLPATVGLCGGGILSLVGIGLGIAGAAQSRSKAVAVLGILLNAVFISIRVVLLLVMRLQAYTPTALP